MNSRFIFRVDASKTIGSGHVQRCISVAEQLSINGYECVFIPRSFEGNLNLLIADHGFPLWPIKDDRLEFSVVNNDFHSDQFEKQDAKYFLETLRKLKPKRNNILVLDHYFLNEAWISLVSHDLNKIVRFDDFTKVTNFCDLIINYAPNVRKSDYTLPEGSKIDLLGGLQ